MLGVHVFKPNFSRVFLNKEKVSKVDWINPTTMIFGMEDYEIVILYLSVLYWKKHNNIIQIYVDEKGYEIFDKLHLLHLYDEIKVFTKSSYNIDNSIFWAAAKVEAMQDIDQPFTIFDLDLFVTENLEKLNFYNNKDIGILHFEKSSLSYPFPHTMPNYNFPREWTWDSYAINVALLHFNDIGFKNLYVEKSLEYMHNNSKKYIMDKMNARMIFAEQRLLGEMVSVYSKSYDLLIKGLYYPTLDNDNVIGFNDVMNLRTAKFVETEQGVHKHSNIKEMEKHINHLWGFKTVLLNDNLKRFDFMNRLLEKFYQDFPNDYEDLKRSLENLYKTANLSYNEFFSKS